MKPQSSPALPQEEILAILLAADEIIAQCGRNMLAKILKGSKDKKLLSLGLQTNAGYGCLSSFTLEQIMEKIDWMIQNDYLAIEMSGDYPLLVFTDRGWTIERLQVIERLLKEWDEWLAEGKTEVDMTYLKDRNREMILLFLERIKETGEPKYIPYLRQWAAIDYKKVKAAIRETIDVLASGQAAAAASFVLAGEREEAERALRTPGLVPLTLKCWDCGERFVFEVEEQKFFRMKGFDDPKRCPSCRQKKWLRRMGIDPEEVDFE